MRDWDDIGGIKMKNCTTHSHACDCREEYFRNLEEVNKVLREAVEFYAALKSYSMDDYQGVSGEMRSYCILYGDKDEINDVTSYAGRRARKALAKADEIMGGME